FGNRPDHITKDRQIRSDDQAAGSIEQRRIEVLLFADEGRHGRALDQCLHLALDGSERPAYDRKCHRIEIARPALVRAHPRPSLGPVHTRRPLPSIARTGIERTGAHGRAWIPAGAATGLRYWDAAWASTAAIARVHSLYLISRSDAGILGVKERSRR